MEEVLEVAEVVSDSGLEDTLAWLLGAIGLVAILAGLGLWLLTDVGLFVLPAALVLLGIVLLTAPFVLAPLLEVLG